MNDNEKDRIAAALNMLRPDWPTRSLRTLLDHHQLSNRSRRDTAVAMVWVACESDTKTPARVLESGPWWHAANVETPDRTHRRPPSKAEECDKHEGEYRLACRGCAADRKAQQEQAAEVQRLAVEDAKAAARAQLRALGEGRPPYRADPTPSAPAVAADEAPTQKETA